MRRLAILALAATVVGFISPAFAQSAGSEFSMQRAVFVARNVGVVGINEVNFYDGKWQIQGRASGGQNITVEVSADTGEIMNVDRWW